MKQHVCGVHLLHLPPKHVLFLHATCASFPCRALTQEDWETNLLPLIDATRYPMLNQPGMTLDLFRVAASWVASRAFGVDNYHGTQINRARLICMAAECAKACINMHMAHSRGLLLPGLVTPTIMCLVNNSDMWERT